MVFKHREYTLNVCVGSLDAHFSEKKWKKYKNKCCLPQKRPYIRKFAIFGGFDFIMK